MDDFTDTLARIRKRNGQTSRVMWSMLAFEGVLFGFNIAIALLEKHHFPGVPLSHKTWIFLLVSTVCTGLMGWIVYRWKVFCWKAEEEERQFHESLEELRQKIAAEGPSPW